MSYLTPDPGTAIDAGGIVLFDFFDFACRVGQFYNLFGLVFVKVDGLALRKASGDHSGCLFEVVCLNQGAYKSTQDFSPDSFM